MEHTIRLDQLTHADFQPHLNQPFVVALEDATPYPLELVQVNRLGSGSPEPARQPFSLLFSNPRKDAYLPQKIYSLEHAEMGALELFLVPLGADQAGMRYEAIFS